ncbi:MAG: L-threonylcarbamoyladenylate synthase [Patescibacteria group bacterium]
MTKNWQQAARAVSKGEIAVIPTDTIYGLVAQAQNPIAVSRLDNLKQRKEDSPYIILISNLSELIDFEISLDTAIKNLLHQLWPGPISVVLNCNNKKFTYLHRGKNLAFRLPDNKELIEFIKITGPVVAPSANPKSLPPAQTITDAKKYFGSNVTNYISAETEPLVGEASTLVDLTTSKPKILRLGAKNPTQIFLDFNK